MEKKIWDLLIKNGTIVNSTGSFQADLAIAKDKIAAVGQLEEGLAERVIHADGRLITHSLPFRSSVLFSTLPEPESQS